MKQLSPGDKPTRHAQTTCFDLGALGKRPSRCMQKQRRRLRKKGLLLKSSVGVRMFVKRRGCTMHFSKATKDTHRPEFYEALWYGASQSVYNYKQTRSWLKHSYRPQQWLRRTDPAVCNGYTYYSIFVYEHKCVAAVQMQKQQATPWHQLWLSLSRNDNNMSHLESPRLSACICLIKSDSKGGLILRNEALHRYPHV